MKRSTREAPWSFGRNINRFHRVFWLTSSALLFEPARVPLSLLPAGLSLLSGARALAAWFQRPLARREVVKMSAPAGKHTHTPIPRCSPQAPSETRWRFPSPNYIFSFSHPVACKQTCGSRSFTMSSLTSGRQPLTLVPVLPQHNRFSCSVLSCYIAFFDTHFR